MESAIPPHLTVARSRPARGPDDFVPAVPSFVARLPESVDQMAMAYLGAQHGEPGIDTGPDGPRAFMKMATRGAPTRLRLYDGCAPAFSVQTT